MCKLHALFGLFRAENKTCSSSLLMWEITTAVKGFSPKLVPPIASRSTGQTVKRQTENLHVDYYVTRDFKSEFKGSALQQIEKNVEEDYVSNVRNNCWKERQTSK